jgi:hypothetical protein
MMRTDFPAFLQSPISLIVFIVSCLVFVSGCGDKDPDELGRDLLPDSDNFFVNLDTAEVIQSFTRLGDSVISSDKSVQLLGKHQDPVFGLSTASFITQVEAPGMVMDFGSNPVIDSAILFIYVNDFYGDSNAIHQITAYEFTDPLRYDTVYYSDFSTEGKFRADPIGSGIAHSGDTLLKIYITDEDLKNRFLTAEDTTFKTNSLFQEMFRGFYLTTGDLSGEEGSILYTSMTNSLSRFSLYFKNDDDTSSRFFYLGRNFGQNINIFSHNYSGAILESFLNNHVENDSVIFLQSMGGVSAIIRFPQLSSWLDSITTNGPIAINNAELILTPVTSTFLEQDPDKFPVGLNLMWIGDDHKYNYMYDYYLNSDLFGGGYDKDNDSYTFNIKIHIQSYLTGMIKNSDLVLSAGNNSNTANRVVLKGGNHSSGYRMKLKLTYTRL